MSDRVLVVFVRYGKSDKHMIGIYRTKKSAIESVKNHARRNSLSMEILDSLNPFGKTFGGIFHPYKFSIEKSYVKD